MKNMYVLSYIIIKARLTKRMINHPVMFREVVEDFLPSFRFRKILSLILIHSHGKTTYTREVFASTRRKIRKCRQPKWWTSTVTRLTVARASGASVRFEFDECAVAIPQRSIRSHSRRSLAQANNAKYTKYTCDGRITYGRRHAAAGPIRRDGYRLQRSLETRSSALARVNQHAQTIERHWMRHSRHSFVRGIRFWPAYDTKKYGASDSAAVRREAARSDWSGSRMRSRDASRLPRPAGYVIAFPQTVWIYTNLRRRENSLARCPCRND